MANEMEKILNLQEKQLKMNQTEVTATNFISILKQYQNHLTYLSLDCFDTLIWRYTASPKDIFFELENKFHFNAAGLSAKLRERAESEARRKCKITSGVSEVTLYDVYRAALPEANESLIESLVEEEFAAELENSYAFEPTIDLMRAAHKAGLKIIIVSDIYYSEKQLRRLLQSKLPPEIYQAISAVFSSCEYHKSKSEGLFKHVLDKINIKSNAVLHIGDNQTADYLAAQLSGMHSIKFSQFSQGTIDNLRLQAISAAYINPSIRNKQGLFSPYRPILSLNHQANDSGEHLIGYNTIGPIMYGFASHIMSEVTRLTESGRKVKVLFLMRDGHLPALACEALLGKKIGTNVRISRFAAVAATLRAKSDVERYLLENVHSLRFSDIGRQLLLSDDLIESICAKLTNTATQAQDFTQLICSDTILQKIFAASRAYRKRLYSYLQREAQLEDGDTALFVDLGYSGTAQKLLEPVFSEELGVTIQGCYLIALRVANWQKSRTGLLDPSHYDDNTLGMLVTHIPILEQICTSNEKSVIDYTNDGEPIFSDTAVNARQYSKLDAIQAECLRFVKDANSYFTRSNNQLNMQMMRDSAAVNLARLIFLPTAKELQFLQEFEFDVNMGTKDVISLFDIKKGLDGLRRRGWLHCAKTNVDQRANYAAEWRAVNLELALTLMAQHRYNLEFSLSDLSHRYQDISLLILQNGQTTEMTLQAVPTHDGYFTLMIPVVNQDYQIAIQFGKNYQWVEFDHAELIKLSALYSVNEAKHSTDASPYLLLHEMQDKSGGLFECLSPESLVLFNTPNTLANEAHIMRFIFRPIVYRTDNAN